MMLPDIPRPEHPRPDFKRNLWLNLNGRWDFCFDPLNEGMASAWFSPTAPNFGHKILVPFSWQSQSAGLTEQQPTCETAWYRRFFTLPDAMAGQRIVLHFGAVDYRATVWINGEPVGEHEGGYLPFEFDITSQLKTGENSLVVRVHDPLDLREIPHGKQMCAPKDIWYECMFTPTSGIWQTVWLEARPACYLRSAQITPDLKNELASFEVDVAGNAGDDVTLKLLISPPQGEVIRWQEVFHFSSETTQPIRFNVPIPQPIMWDTENPNLYEVQIELDVNGGSDTVESYFGMRSIGLQDGKILINNRPIYLRSALDQGYWPEGLLTAPSDDALKLDIELAKRHGLNSLRKHIKFEDPRYYYWADRLGLMIWQDTPSPTLFTQTACQRLETEQMGAINRDYNHPSIIIWAPYNESWGLEYALDKSLEMQQWVCQLYDKIKSVDPLRLIVDNSGWQHVKTDLADIHYYINDRLKWRKTLDTLCYHPDESAVVLEDMQNLARSMVLTFYADGYRHQNEPLIMSEYGTGGRSDRSWDVKWQTNEMRRYPQITGYVYTEIYDIEHEYAGFLTYDRHVKETGYDPKIVHSDDYLVLDVEGLRYCVQPGDKITIDPYFSTYASSPVEKGSLIWKLIPITSADPLFALALDSGTFTFTAQPYDVTRLQPIQLTIPDGQTHLQLWAWVMDEKGCQRTVNFLDFAVKASPLPPQEQMHTNRGIEFINRLELGSPVKKHNFDTLRANHRAEIVGGDTTGFLEYAIPYPKLDPGTVQALELAFEAAPYPSELAQSVVGKPRPTSLSIFINDEEVNEWNLNDLNIHAGGALTRLNGLGVGEHGDLIKIQVPASRLSQIFERAYSEGALRVRFEIKRTARNHGGLMLFGRNAGKYGLDPEIRWVAADQ